jgi:hypothetical protein
MSVYYLSGSVKRGVWGELTLHLKIIDFTSRQLKQPTRNSKNKSRKIRVTTIFRAMLLLVGRLASESASRVLKHGDKMGNVG